MLQKHGCTAVIFIPVAYMEDGTPLPHETLLVQRGMHNPTLDWGLVRELDAGGVRVESHGIAHRPLAEVSLDEAVREIAVSKLKLEEQLGRPGARLRLRQGLGGALPPRAREHPQAGGLRHRVHVDLPRERARDEPVPARALQRRAVPARTFDLVLSGACDLIALKDTVAGTHARRLFNQALGTSTR